MSLFHIHKWGDVRDGCQYCSKCGKARVVTGKCQHMWKHQQLLEKRGEETGKLRALIYVQRCSKCGEMSSFKVSV